MKIKRVLLSALCMLFIHANAQKKDKDKPAAPSAEHEINIYNNAMQYRDYEAAKNAVYALIEKHPEVNSWLDSLTRLYYYIGANNQTVMVGNACLKKDSSDKDIIEIVAISDNYLNHNEEALEMYKKLQARAKSPYYAYQVAYDEYLLKRFEDCSKSLEAIIKDPASDTSYININMGQNSSQKVPLKAASLNLLGVIQLELKETEKAKANFDAALKIKPDFQLAKENMDIANKPKEPADKK